MQEQQYDTRQGEFYTAAAKYWDRIPPTINGMLGGFGFISQSDVRGSTIFLKSLFEVRRNLVRSAREKIKKMNFIYDVNKKQRAAIFFSYKIHRPSRLP